MVSHGAFPTRSPYAVWNIVVDGTVAVGSTASIALGSTISRRPIVISGSSSDATQSRLLCDPTALARAVQYCGTRTLAVRDMTVVGCTAGFLQSLGGSVVIRNVVFVNTSVSAWEPGGAVADVTQTAIVIDHSEFVSSVSNGTSGGGAVLAHDSTVLLQRSVFHGSVSATVGGAVVVATTQACNIDTSASTTTTADGSLPAACTTAMSRLVVSNCGFDRGWATQGGAVSADSTVVNIDNSVFANGVGVACGGGLSVTGASSLVLSSSVFVGNRGGSGGGVCLRGLHSAAVVESLFVNNSAAVAGGAMDASDVVSVEIDGGVWSGCSAGVAGGSLALTSSGSTTSVTALVMTVSLRNMSVSESVVSGGNGGGVYWAPCAACSLSMTGSSVEGVAPAGGGGVLFVDGTASDEGVVDVGVDMDGSGSGSGGVVVTAASTNVYSGSTAGFGPLVATSTRGIVAMCDGAVYDSTSSLHASCFGNLTVEGMSSIVLHVVDGLGQFAATDSATVCGLVLNDTSVAVIGDTEVARYGVVRFAALTVLGVVATSYSASVVCSFVGGVEGRLVQPAAFVFRVPKCPAGSAPSDTGLSCVTCAPGFVSFSGDACVPCGRGTYASKPGSAECVPW